MPRVEASPMLLAIVKIGLPTCRIRPRGRRDSQPLLRELQAAMCSAEAMLG
jgi:hypothetical protein